MRKREFLAGIISSLPVFIGYFSVSFGFGAMAVSLGISVFEATLISFTNLTSAGQFAGLTVISEAALLFDMFLTQLIINSRYGLMSLALGQKMGSRFGFVARLASAFINTDEIFALAMARQDPLTVPYMLGLGVLPILGWSAGTFLGAVVGSILPHTLATALGVALYGMFVAIIVPQARANKPTLWVSLLAVFFSCMFHWLPIVKELSSGLSIVFSTILASVISAFIFPVPDEEAES